MKIEDYLHQQKQLSNRSIATYKRYQSKYLVWAKQNSITPDETTYTDLLTFTKYCKEKGLQQNYITKLFTGIRHYFNYLKYIGKIDKNPASNLHLRCNSKRLAHDLLTASQLDKIYNDYPIKGISGKRNKNMLGLLIYQGLTSNELEIIEPSALQLHKGKIEIPGSRKSNGRVINLEARQLLLLHEYVTTTRKLILSATEKESDKLFVSLGQGNTLRNSLDKLVRTLRTQHANFINARQLRQSRIAIWTKQYGLRQAQYLAGHKYVSSTERYQSTDLEALQYEIDKHHPSNG